MTREQAKKQLPIIKAFADGAVIEFRSGPSFPWQTGYTLSFDCEGYEYRIKPEPKLRPWKPEEVPVGALTKVEGLNRIYVIIGNCPDKPGYFMLAEGEKVTFEDRLFSQDGGKTWLPCGVEES